MKNVKWTRRIVLEIWQMGGAGCDAGTRMTDIAIMHNKIVDHYENELQRLRGMIDRYIEDQQYR